MFCGVRKIEDCDYVGVRVNCNQVDQLIVVHVLHGCYPHALKVSCGAETHVDFIEAYIHDAKESYLLKDATRRVLFGNRSTSMLLPLEKVSLVLSLRLNSSFNNL